MPGQTSQAKNFDEEADHAVKAVAHAVEQKTGKPLGDYKGVSYCTQVVAGTNYFVKVETGGEHLHLRIFKDLSGNYSLSAVQTGKSGNDHIGYFEAATCCGGGCH